VLSTPSVGLDRMFAEFDAAAAAGQPDMARLVAIAAEHGVVIAPHAG
jgi:hypothetical protein